MNKTRIDSDIQIFLTASIEKEQKWNFTKGRNTFLKNEPPNKPHDYSSHNVREKKECPVYVLEFSMDCCN